MLAIQIFILIALFLAFALTWRRARQGAVRRLEALAWSVVWIAGAIVVARPEVASWFANTVGIGRGSDLAVYLAIILLLILAFNLYVQHHRLQRDITELVRKEALKDLDRV
ncbi:MAG: DUF2304 domain-containing protein [Candidatus Uhrbacteria bacterium]|nr:DUF2304 domain-containing protein [Candidatus Uhrbacteria bacterium]